MAALDKPRTADMRHTRVKEWGTSRAVRIPKAVCDATGIGVGSDLTMESGVDDLGAFILIRDAETPHRSFADVPCASMEEVFRDYTGDYEPHEVDWGPDVGSEVVA